MSWEVIRYGLKRLAEERSEYCGYPMPIEGKELIIEPRHPLSEGMMKLNIAQQRPSHHACSVTDVRDDVAIVNHFYSYQYRSEVIIWREGSLTRWGIIPGIHHFSYDLNTLECYNVWSPNAEIKAMEKLRTLVSDHVFDQYLLTGMFGEKSKKSGLIYFFRKLRPTVAVSLKPKKRHDEILSEAVEGEDRETRILCCLCLHPIGYYGQSWAGAMVPTDDVIAHLLMMRSDEHYYWRKANQIQPHHPNAGL